MNFQIRECIVEELNILKNYISQFELDDRSLHHSEFLVAEQNKNIIGFGRIREHKGCSELCSLGVIHPERNKGVGKTLTKALIQKAKQPLYLACIIPNYFEPFGFKICDDYPVELKDKLDYCTKELVVHATYVIMQALSF
jgi:N-acetylglutamate synthase-like GNAT family acetyltransferase